MSVEVREEMNIAEKIWYTWLVLSALCFLSACVLDDDYGTHERAVNILLGIGLAPIGIGIIGFITWLLYKIWV